MKTFRNPENVHKPLAAYSHQAEISLSERLLVLSGQVGMQPDGSIPDDAIEQLQVALENIDRNLHAADMAVNDIIKLTIYAVGQMDAEKRRSVLTDYFKDFSPCMTLVFVAALAAPVFKIEVEAVASCEK